MITDRRKGIQTIALAGKRKGWRERERLCLVRAIEWSIKTSRVGGNVAEAKEDTIPGLAFIEAGSCTLGDLGMEASLHRQCRTVAVAQRGSEAWGGRGKENTKKVTSVR